MECNVGVNVNVSGCLYVSKLWLTGDLSLSPDVGRDRFRHRRPPKDKRRALSFAQMTQTTCRPHTNSFIDTEVW